MSDFLTLKGGEVDVGGAPEVISVLPFGHVVSQKGEFDVDEESLAAMKAQIAERGVDLVVDYEHQTLTGDRAPAAGWVKELFAEDGHIKARVEWTLPAKQYLENKEYRYLSLRRQRQMCIRDSSPRSSPSASRTTRRRASTPSPSPTPQRSRA